jgi:hypothetical protein
MMPSARKKIPAIKYQTTREAIQIIKEAKIDAFCSKFTQSIVEVSMTSFPGYY